MELHSRRRALALELRMQRGGTPGWNQEWRKPLREALDWLRDAITPRFEALGTTLLRDPWAARDAYINVILIARPRPESASAQEHFARR